MQHLAIFIFILIINTLVLHLITSKLLMLENTSLLKAFLVTICINLFTLFAKFLIGAPTGFHAEMFAGIFRYLLFIPGWIFIKIIYAMDWTTLVYFIVANWIAGLLTVIILIPIFIKLIMYL